MNLSFFHEELLLFLKRQALAMEKTSGLEGCSNSWFADFRQTIEKAVVSETEACLPLAAIIDHYQSLIGSRSAAYLERRLLESFSVSLAKDKALRIYRGLPRVYKRENPAHSQLKTHFMHLSSLKQLAAEKHIFREYAQRSIPCDAKISVFSWVIGDGWGDYIAASAAIEILTHRFPDLELSWVVLFPKHLKPAPKIPSGCKTHLIVYEKEAEVSLIEQEALEILRTSDIILQIPTYYPSLQKLQKAVNAIPFQRAAPKWLSIGEYGFLESDMFHPKTGNRSMGLHFLEKGILIRAPHVRAPSFCEIENSQLLEWLFDTVRPGEEDVACYTSASHFYLAYLTSPIGGAVYLHALIHAHERDGKRIDLCCPDIGWLIQYIDLQTRLGLPILNMNGVRLELFYQDKFLVLMEGKGGKKIRIFCPYALSSEDFRLLVSLSEEFIAIRGDQSFSEVVSANKCFFYDARGHARYFLKDLLAIAENRIGMHKSSLEVFRGMGNAYLHHVSTDLSGEEWVEETYFQEKKPWQEIALNIGMALQDPDCLAGFKKLNRMIAEEHAFNEFLCHLIQREFCHRETPDIARIEAEAMKSFVEGSESLNEAIETLRDRLHYGR